MLFFDDPAILSRSSFIGGNPNDLLDLETPNRPAGESVPWRILDISLKALFLLEGRIRSALWHSYWPTSLLWQVFGCRHYDAIRVEGGGWVGGWEGSLTVGIGAEEVPRLQRKKVGGGEACGSIGG